MVSLDKAPSVDVNDQTPDPGLFRTPQQVESANALTKRLDDVLGPALFLGRELRDEPGFLAVGVSSYETVHDGRLACLGVGKMGADGVDLDVLGCGERFSASGRPVDRSVGPTIIDVDKLFIDKRPIRSRVPQGGILL